MGIYQKTQKVEKKFKSGVTFSRSGIMKVKQSNGALNKPIGCTDSEKKSCKKH